MILETEFSKISAKFEWLSFEALSQKLPNINEQLKDSCGWAPSADSEVIERLGKGGYGYVIKLFDYENNKYFASKCAQKNKKKQRKSN